MTQNIETEEWRDVKGYEGIYKVSNLGNFKNVITNKMLHPTVRKDSGYSQITLGNKSYRAHRVIAEAFLENPNNLPQINHKDENKSNNCVDNLEWCSAKYNLNYGTRNSRCSETLKGHKMFTDIEMLIKSSHTLEAEKKRRETYKRNGKTLGIKNHFYGKHHTKESKLKISLASRGTIWISNETLRCNKKIDPKDLSKYLDLGYRKGFVKWKLMENL